MTRVINTIEITNPFNLRQQRRGTVEWDGTKSLADYFPEWNAVGDFVVAHNGRIVPPQERGAIYPMPDDYVILCPTVRGGGGDSGKMAIRIIVMIVLTMIAPGAGTAVAEGMVASGVISAASAGAVATAVQAGIMVAGGMVMNAMAKSEIPKGPDTSPSYGIDGAKNTSLEGTPVPAVYGTFRMGGNVINNYTVNDGNNQILHVLLNCGEGPIEAIEDIQINDNPLSTFVTTGAVQAETRLGDATQSPIEFFNDVVVPDPVGQKVTTTFFTRTTSTRVDKVRLNLVFPNGLCLLTDDGGVNHKTVTLQADYRRVGDTEWTRIVNTDQIVTIDEVVTWLQVRHTPTNPNREPSTYTYAPRGNEVRVGNNIFALATGHSGQGGGGTISSELPNQPQHGLGAGYTWVGIVTANPSSVPTSDHDFKITAWIKTPLRRTLETPGILPLDFYEVRLRRTTEGAPPEDTKNFDEVYWTDLVRIMTDDVQYAYTALVGLRIRLGNQITSFPRITQIVKGRKIAVWNETTKVWETKHSANPAWISLDILSNKRIGGGAPLSRFDMPMWRQWAKYCDDNDLEFNGIFDTAGGNVWDAVQKVMRCGHAQLIRTGTRYSVAIDRVSDPVMMFSVGNMIKGSFKETWLPMSDRVNEIEASFINKDEGYKQTTLKAVDSSAIALGRPQRTAQLDLFGVTSADQAWKDINIMLNMNRYIQRTVEFAAPIEAIGCTLGDVVLIQHDMPQWGFAGRVEQGCTTTVLNLDRIVRMEAGKAYKAFVHQSTQMTASGTITSVAYVNGQVNLLLGGLNLGGPNPPKFKRIRLGTPDYAVLDTFDNGAGGYGVTIEAPAGINAGDPYQLWDYDVIETRDVVNTATVGSPVEAQQITLQSALSAAPAVFTNWMFGEVNKVAKPFRIKKISGSHDYRRDILAIEYNASVWDPAGATPTPNYSSLTSAVQHVVIESVGETWAYHGASYKSRVTVGFHSSQATYKQARVYVSRNGAAWEFAGTHEFNVTVDAAKYEQLQFKVVAEDIFGKSAPDSSAPVSQAYVVKGVQVTPATPQDFAYAVDGAGFRLSWAAPEEADWLTTKIAVGASFETGELIFDGKATETIWPFQLGGTYQVRCRHFTEGGVSAEALLTINIAGPAQPTITGVDVTQGSATVKWTDAKTTQPLSHYIVKLGTQGQTFNQATEVAKAAGSATAQTMNIAVNGNKVVYVQAVDMGGNAGPAQSTTFNVNQRPPIDTTAPPALAGFGLASVGLQTITLQWTLPVYTQGNGPAAVNLYAADWPSGTRPTFAQATLVEKVLHPQTRFVDTVGTGVRRVYWAKNMTQEGIEEATVAGGTLGIEATSSKIGNSDLGNQVVQAANLANGSVGPTQLADDAVTLTKFANGIEPVGLVDTLPATAGYTGPKVVLLSTDGKVYRLVSNAWTRAVDGGDITANSIVAGSISAGAVGTTQLASKAITTDKLLVTGQGAVLNHDPMFQDLSAWSAFADELVAGVADLPVGSTVLQSRAGQQRDVSTVQLIPIDGSKRYRLEMHARQVNGTTARAYLMVQWYDANGVLLQSNQAQPGGAGSPAGWNNGTYSYFGLINAVVPTSLTKYSINFGLGETAAIPSNARFVKLGGLLNYSPAVAGASIQLTNVRLWQRADADLIVDGSIVASKLAANAIAVGTAAIQNGAIVNAMIANLDAGKINTGFLSADRIQANTITAAHINSNGLTIKDNAGNVIFGVGVNLDSSRINPAAGWLNSNVSLSATGQLQGAGGGQVMTVPVRDILSERTIDRPPSWYPVGTTREFKTASALGLTGVTYCTLETIIQYADASGGACYQYAYHNDKTWRRHGVLGASSWAGAWVQDLDRNVYTGDLNATSDVGLVVRGALTLNGNACIRAVEGTWDADCYSRDGFSGGAFASFSPTTANNLTMAGLNSDPTTDSSYTSLDYAFYCAGTVLHAREDGNNVQTFSSYATTDVLSIVYDGTHVSYMQNGVVLRKVAAAPNRKFHFDSSVARGGLTGIRFGPVSGNSWGSDTGSLTIAYPDNGGYASSTPTVNGAIKIRLPQSYSNTMLRFKVTVYEYASAAAAVYEVGGYTYASGSSWLNTFATYNGKPASTRRVRFGHDGTSVCVWIGEPGGSWAYPQVRVSDLVAGYTNYSAAQWATGWTVTFDTAAATNVTSQVDTPVANGAFSGLDQITSSNAATFIAVAAIGAAQIGVLTAQNLTVTALSNTVNGGASSGGRVTIESNKITVFDASNAARVKIGYLL